MKNCSFNSEASEDASQSCAYSYMPPIYLLLVLPRLVMLYCEKVFFKPVTQIILFHCFSALYYSHFIKHSPSLRIVHHYTTDPNAQEYSGVLVNI